MPVADPADRLYGDHNARLRSRLLVIPLRRRGAHALPVKLGKLAARLVADAGTIRPQMPVGNPWA